MLTVTTKTIVPLIKDCLKAKIVPMVTSSPGMGKSSIYKQIAEENKLKVIDLRLSQCDITDLNGLPNFMEVNGKTKAGYVPMDTFPIEGDKIPEGYNGWLLIMDELNSAPESVQAASYKVILDREVGIHKLHPNVWCVAAGNKETDNAIVNPLGTAMQSRMSHLEMELNYEDWIEWAIDNGINSSIISYINWKPQELHNFNPNHTDKTFACPRTWNFLSDIMKSWKDITDDKLPLIAGTVGLGAANGFKSYVDNFSKLPKWDDILADPENVQFDDSPEICWALTGVIADHVEKNTITTVLPFMERMGIEFQLITFKQMAKKIIGLSALPELKTWKKKNIRMMQSLQG